MKAIFLALIIFILTSCATPSLTEKLATSKKPRIAILKLNITAPIKKISSIQDSYSKDVTIESVLREIEERATVKLVEFLQKSDKVEPVLVPIDYLEIKTGKRPSKEEIEKIRKDFAVDAIFFGEIPWYGKTKLLYPILGMSLDIAAESIALGILTNWNSTIVLANVGLELLTGAPLWFGGAYIFGWAFRPVSIDAYAYSAGDGSLIWENTVDQVASGDELKKFPEEDRKKKEIQLETSLNKAVHSLSNSIIGEAETPFANVGLLAGAAWLNQGDGKWGTFGLAGSLNLDPRWQIGGQFNIITPHSKFKRMLNFDAAIKRIWERWNIGLLLGFNVAEKDDDSESFNFNAGGTAGYDWRIGKSNFSIGPQLDYIWSPVFHGYTDLNIMAAIKYSL